MCESCDEWKLGCVRVKDCLSYVDGQWCVGNLVCGGFSVSNYLQGNLGTGLTFCKGFAALSSTS